MNSTVCRVELRRGQAAAQGDYSRDEFAARLAVIIEEGLAGFHVESATSRRDDARHLSGIHARLVLKDRLGRVAAIGVSARESQSNIDAALCSGLIWLDRLRRARGGVDRLMIFAPRGRATTLATRLTMVQARGAQISLYEVDEASGNLEPVAAFDQGDLADNLRRAAIGARWPRASMDSYEIGPRDSARHSAPDCDSPERLLEAIIRRDVRAIDPTLDARYVYSQVPVYRGERRAFIDLLAATGEGNLVIIELKVSEDAEFPFQGLDYWLRVEWHRRRGDFERRGYFKTLKLADAPPLVYLVAPLLRFHGTTRLIARSIAKRVPVYRIGINEDWRSGVRVRLMERLNR
jgi:hypothetical protein